MASEDESMQNNEAAEHKIVVDESLLSNEKLDQASPDVWSEKIPGVSEFISINTPAATSPPAWTRGLSDEDVTSLYQLGALSPTGLIAEIKKLYDQAYQLGVQEAKEMTRGKYLNIFEKTKKK